MSRRKKKRVEQHQDNHRWVISYADFITLLFAFFVVMYAISSINVSKYRSVSEGMKTAFNKKNKTNAGGGEIVTIIPNKQSDQHFDELGKNLGKTLSQLKNGDFHINRQEGWIEIDMKAGSLFASGSADLKPLAMIKLMQIASTLEGNGYPISIEGYTDNIPMDSSQYPSNWELSSARAAAVARTLITYGIDPGRLTIMGFGEQYPISDNNNEIGRAKNRRVNMIIAKDKMVPRLFNPQLNLMTSQKN